MALLDRARSAIRQHKPDRALRELDDYRRAIPHAVLLTEANVLEVEALVQAGRRSAASSSRMSYIISWPILACPST